MAFSLLSGSFLVPFQIKAESADTALQPNASCSAFLEDKDVKEKENVIDTKKDIYISGDCLVPTVNRAHISGVDDSSFSSDETSVYVVRNGDSILQIANMFGVSANTIRWANDLKIGDVLKEGQILLILPISGIQHVVKKGQTIESIAKLYNADISDIASFNGISEESKLAIGDELIIPDAEMDTSNVSQPNSSKNIVYQKTPAKNIFGYFINPVPNYRRKSQGIHGRNGVDLAAPTGTKIVASASGRVLMARTGYNGGYGNMVIIQHPNGTQTLYAHQSRIAVRSGEQVSQGQVIGYIGSTGRSTGPHLHYEERNTGTTNSANRL